MAAEQDTRLNILNTLLTTPHRKLEQVWPVHQEMIAQDPLFYVRLGAWYTDTGEIRDHKEMFVINLCLSDFTGHRDVGLALLREMPPYQVRRVVDFIHGTKKTVKVKSEKPKKGKKKAEGTATEVKEEVKTQTISAGLQKNLPGSMRTEISRYLKEREANTDWFDATVLTARHDMKRLYALTQTPPNERAQDTLFFGKPPEGGRVHAVKVLSQAKTPAEQAAAILEHKIPYLVAASVVTAMTPTVLLALIENMSSAELVNSLGSLKKRGVFDNPDLKALVEKKLEKAKKGKRVSALKAQEAIKTAGLDEDMQVKVSAVADAQVKARGKIKKSTALLVDKSLSQQTSIEVGKRIAAMVSAVCEAGLWVYAFDTMPYAINPGTPLKGATLEMSDWERAFQGIKAQGGTSCGCALAAMERAGQRVEQLMIVGDGGDNSQPLFVNAYRGYCAKMNVQPNVILVHIPGDPNTLVLMCKQAGIGIDVWEFVGDYYSLPGLIPLLSKGGRLDLLLSVMEYPLPQRKAS